MLPLHRLSAGQLARLVSGGEVSAVTVVEHFLERARGFSDRLGAFVTFTADDARAAARRVDDAGPQLWQRAPLAGVPTAVKDLLPMAGARTTFGSLAFADHVPDRDAHVVRLLREAGMPLLGKTSTAEFGFAPYTEPDVAPPARCPWDLSRSAGGSSGGAAAAVAAGLVPVAHGSDSAGSIRIPASVCGLVGLKTTRGRISNAGVGTERFGLAAQGVLSRTVADAAVLLDQLATPHPGDPYPPLGRPAGGFAGALGGAVAPLRVEVWTTSPLTRQQPHEAYQEAVQRTATTLKELGHRVTWAEPPDLSELLATFVTLWTASAAGIDVPEGREHQLQPLTRALRAQGRTRSGPDVCRAIDTMHTAVRVLVESMGTWDVLLTPTLAELPWPLGSLRDDEDPMGSVIRQAMCAPYTAMWNFAGNPAVSLPVHWTADDLPVGVQLVGRPAEEETLLGVAASLEAVFDWAARHPDESAWS